MPNDAGELKQESTVFFSCTFSIPGEMAPVSGTVFDFRQPAQMGKHISEVPDGVGYDHSFCVNDPSMSSACAR